MKVIVLLQWKPLILEVINHPPRSEGEVGEKADLNICVLFEDTSKPQPKSHQLSELKAFVPLPGTSESGQIKGSIS